MPSAADASVDIQNKLTGQVLEQLKSAFGGMPTEGERKVMLDLQGSINLKAPQRESIINRALTLVRRRNEQAKVKANQLREGTYFSEDGGTESTPTQTSNAYKSKVPPKDNPNARQAPNGSWWVKGANGKFRPVENGE